MAGLSLRPSERGIGSDPGGVCLGMGSPQTVVDNVDSVDIGGGGAFSRKPLTLESISGLVIPSRPPQSLVQPQGSQLTSSAS